MDNQQIFDMATSLLSEVVKEENRHLEEKKLEDKFSNRYEKLKKKSGALFAMIIKDKERFEIGKLQEMLGLSNRINNGEMSQHDGSVIVGQKYYDEYIKPVIR